MASISRDEKALKSDQLIVSTEPVLLTPQPSHDKSPGVSMDIPRNSTASTPCYAHVSNGFDTDVEAMMPTQSSDHLNKLSTTGARPKQDSVWPGKDHWKQKARAAKINNRSCQCMARLSKRTRIMVKLAIALLIVGIAVGVGFGISKPLGAPIWKPQDG